MSSLSFIFLCNRRLNEIYVFVWTFGSMKKKTSALHTKKSIFELNLKFYCNYAFPIDLVPNGIPFVAKSVRKLKLLSKFGLDQQDLEKSSLVSSDVKTLKKILSSGISLGFKAILGFVLVC